MNKNNLLQRLLDAGYPKEEVFHHESDLYIFVTEQTTAILDQWLQDNGWMNLKNDPFLMSEFKDRITGRRMYDIAFQYNPAVMAA